MLNSFQIFYTVIAPDSRETSMVAINFSELAKKYRDPARSSVHIIIINK